MRRFAGLSIFWMCAFSFGARATPVTTTCLPKTTFDQYQAQGSCISGNVMFSNFTFTSSATGTPRSASNTSIQPLPDQGLYSQIGLSAVGAADSSSVFQEVTLGFLETALAGFSITSLAFEFNGTASHGGLASITEDFCIGHPILGCPQSLGGEVVLTSNSPTFHSLVALPGASSVFLAFTTRVDAGTFGSADFVQFENSTGTVPEPRTLPVLASVVLALIAIHRLDLSRRRASLPRLRRHP